MEINQFLLIEDVRTTLKIVLVFLIALVFWLRLYRAAVEDAELETLKAAPLRMVTEEDFDIAAAAMDDDEKLAVQRRAEALNWYDDGEIEQKTA